MSYLTLCSGVRPVRWGGSTSWVPSQLSLAARRLARGSCRSRLPAAAISLCRCRLPRAPGWQIRRSESVCRRAHRSPDTEPPPAGLLAAVTADGLGRICHSATRVLSEAPLSLCEPLMKSRCVRESLGVKGTPSGHPSTQVCRAGRQAPANLPLRLASPHGAMTPPRVGALRATRPLRRYYLVAAYISCLIAARRCSFQAYYCLTLRLAAKQTYNLRPRATWLGTN